MATKGAFAFNLLRIRTKCEAFFLQSCRECCNRRFCFFVCNVSSFFFSFFLMCVIFFFCSSFECSYLVVNSSFWVRSFFEATFIHCCFVSGLRMLFFVVSKPNCIKKRLNTFYTKWYRLNEILPIWISNLVKIIVKYNVYIIAIVNFYYMVVKLFTGMAVKTLKTCSLYLNKYFVLISNN